MHDAQVLLGSTDPSPRFPPVLAERGFYLAIRPDGFALHMSASAAHISEMRKRVFGEVCGAGAGEEAADAARLVASELVGNAVRLYGPSLRWRSRWLAFPTRSGSTCTIPNRP